MANRAKAGTAKEGGAIQASGGADFRAADWLGANPACHFFQDVARRICLELQAFFAKNAPACQFATVSRVGTQHHAKSTFSYQTLTIITVIAFATTRLVLRAAIRGPCILLFFPPQLFAFHPVVLYCTKWAEFQ